MSSQIPDDPSLFDSGSGDSSSGRSDAETITDAAAAAGGAPKEPVLGDYRILERIGSGGMGHVFKARHLRMDRIVALKVLPAAVMRNATAVERFEREMRAAAQLFHPNIVTAFDAGEQNGIPYLVMEYVDGVSFADLVRQRGPLPVDEAVDYVLQAARGLAYAHSRQVIHRDIKPSNLMLTKQGVVKILDMGMARMRREMSEPGEGAPDGLTETGVIIGTVDFMSPEQAKNAREVDHRADIYSLGCTLYYLLVGKPVYSGDMVQTLLAHAANPVPPLRRARPDASEQLDRVYQKMLAKSPADRYQSMAEVVEALEACAAGAPASTVLTDREGRLGRLAEAFQDTAGESAAKSPSTIRKVHAVGVDFGGTAARIAYLDDSGAARSLGEADEARAVPAAVMIDGSNIAVGREALEQIGTKASCVADRIKPLFKPPAQLRRLGGEAYPPEVLAGLIVKKLADDSRGAIGGFEQVALGAPVYFDEARRKTLLDAAQVAGLAPLKLVNDTTAIAVAYQGREADSEAGEGTAAEQTLMVVDGGAAGVQAAIYRCQGRRITALAAAGDEQLGGWSWDDRLADLVAGRFLEEHGLDPRREAAAAARLRRACEAAKRSLSTASRATITFQFRGRASRVRITREDLERAAAPLLQGLQRLAEGVLQAAKRNWAAVDQLLLTGGLARIPAVRRMFRELSGAAPDTSLVELNPVALGAALAAADALAEREGRPARFEVQDVCTLSLGVVGIDPRSGRRRNVKLIRRNTPLPAVAKRTFRIGQRDRESFHVRLVQGESMWADECVRIGKCTIGELPASVPPDAPVTVEVHCEAPGRVRVILEAAGHRVERALAQGFGLPPEHMERWRQWVDTMMLCSNV